MEPNTQEVPGYFVWHVPGKSVVVQLHLDVVDRMGADIQRGFGAVPKRGAEVGGVLFGSIEPGEKTIVRIDDFEPVACAYRRGPSFYLSEAEHETLGNVVTSERPGPNGMLSPVGYYRSHTRDGAVALGTEDLELIGRYFPDANQVALLVKPFATKVSLGGFLVREDGSFPAETLLEFPFRRREMLGEEAPARRSMQERKSRGRERREGRSTEQSYEALGSQSQAPEYATEPAPEYAASYPPSYATPYAAPPPIYLEEFSEPPPKSRNPWMWVPLGLIFLALFTALGYELAVTFAPSLRANEGAAAFALDLSAGRNGESLTVRWNRDSLAVRAAQRGVLEIEDGEFSKPVELDAAHLKEGTVIYQNSSPIVRFRLVIFLTPSVTLNETVEWK